MRALNTVPILGLQPLPAGVSVYLTAVVLKEAEERVEM